MAADGAILCGDCVEIVGLEASSSRELNGQFATVLAVCGETGRCEVSIGGVNGNMKAANLRRNVFQPVECVEICGLQSEGGRAMNGKVGVVGKYVPETARYEIHVAGGDPCNLKPCNIRRLPGSAPAAAGPAELQDGGCAGEATPTSRRGAQPEAGAAALGGDASDALATEKKRARPGSVGGAAADGTKTAKRRSGGSKAAAAAVDEGDDLARRVVLKEAEAAGMGGALLNLASREAVVEGGYSHKAMLVALKSADGLVNKAKSILLGGA